MRKLFVLLALAVLAASVSFADDKPKTDEKPKAAEKPKSDEKAKTDAKEMSGISILGNQDSPKSLVIVPWKSSEIGKGIGLSNALNDRATAVDKDVFSRELHYYDIRSGEGRSGESHSSGSRN